jgi:hypothetical protein
MDRESAELRVDLGQLVWLTCGREAEYQILWHPEHPANFSWRRLLDSIFTTYATEGQAKQQRGCLTLPELSSRPMPYIAAAFDDPECTDLHKRNIKHFIVVLDVDSDALPQLWHLHLLTALRPAFAVLLEASRFEEEAVVRRRARDRQPSQTLTISGAVQLPEVAEPPERKVSGDGVSPQRQWTRNKSAVPSLQPRFCYLPW